MRKILLLVALFSIGSFTSFSQKGGTVKQYVYARAVSGGAMAVDENGRPRSKPAKQYFIYIETFKGSPTISAIYINGLSYTGKAVKVGSPVIVNDNSAGAGKETLVAKTSNQVWQVSVERNETAAKPSSALNKTIKSNEFVMKGFLNGKSFLISAKKIKELQPLMAE